MQSISIFSKGFRFLLCAIDIFSKYAFLVPLKDKKGSTIVNAFQSILKDSMKLHSKRKPKTKAASSITILLKNGYKKRI